MLNDVKHETRKYSVKEYGVNCKVIDKIASQEVTNVSRLFVSKFIELLIKDK